MPTTTNYIWDDENYLAESDATNTINVVYTNEPRPYGNLVSSRISGEKRGHPGLRLSELPEQQGLAPGVIVGGTVFPERKGQWEFPGEIPAFSVGFWLHGAYHVDVD